MSTDSTAQSPVEFIVISRCFCPVCSDCSFLTLLCASVSDLDAAHHRHWPGVLKVIAGCHISLFQMPLPEDAVQLGGSMSLHGNHMTLACFHGPNFRSKSWALFHLEEPNITFWTEAQKIWEDGQWRNWIILLLLIIYMFYRKHFYCGYIFDKLTPNYFFLYSPFSDMFVKVTLKF